MEKIVVYNNKKEILDVIEGVVSATPSLDSVTYLTEKNGAGKLKGIEGGYIILNDLADETTLDFQEVLDFMKQLKIEELSAQCREAITQGFEYNGDYFTYSIEDQQNFNQQLALLGVSAPLNGIEQKTENNGVKVYDMYAYIDICKAGASHKEKKREILRNAKDTLMNTVYSSVQELKGYHVSFDE
jgi:hypothetical protein